MWASFPLLQSQRREVLGFPHRLCGPFLFMASGMGLPPPPRVVLKEKARGALALWDYFSPLLSPRE